MNRTVHPSPKYRKIQSHRRSPTSHQHLSQLPCIHSRNTRNLKINRTKPSKDSKDPQHSDHKNETTDPTPRYPYQILSIPTMVSILHRLSAARPSKSRQRHLSKRLGQFHGKLGGAAAAAAAQDSREYFSGLRGRPVEMVDVADLFAELMCTREGDFCSVRMSEGEVGGGRRVVQVYVARNRKVDGADGIYADMLCLAASNAMCASGEEHGYSVLQAGLMHHAGLRRELAAMQACLRKCLRHVPPEGPLRDKIYIPFQQPRPWEWMVASGFAQNCNTLTLFVALRFEKMSAVFLVGFLLELVRAWTCFGFEEYMRRVAEAMGEEEAFAGLKTAYLRFKSHMELTAFLQERFLKRRRDRRVEFLWAELGLRREDKRNVVFPLQSQQEVKDILLSKTTDAFEVLFGPGKTLQQLLDYDGLELKNKSFVWNEQPEEEDKKLKYPAACGTIHGPVHLALEYYLDKGMDGNAKSHPNKPTAHLGFSGNVCSLCAFSIQRMRHLVYPDGHGTLNVSRRIQTSGFPSAPWNLPLLAGAHLTREIKGHLDEMVQAAIHDAYDSVFDLGIMELLGIVYCRDGSGSESSVSSGEVCLDLDTVGEGEGEEGEDEGLLGWDVVEYEMEDGIDGEVEGFIDEDGEVNGDAEEVGPPPAGNRTAPLSTIDEGLEDGDAVHCVVSVSEGQALQNPPSLSPLATIAEDEELSTSGIPGTAPSAQTEFEATPSASPCILKDVDNLSNRLPNVAADDTRAKWRGRDWLLGKLCGREKGADVGIEGLAGAVDEEDEDEDGEGRSGLGLERDREWGTEGV